MQHDGIDATVLAARMGTGDVKREMFKSRREAGNDSYARVSLPEGPSRNTCVIIKGSQAHTA